MNEHEWRGLTKFLVYLVYAREPLHVEFPVGMAKGEKECRITLDTLALSKSNAVLRNRADPVILRNLMHMIKHIDPHFVDFQDLHGTHIDVPPSCWEWILQLGVCFISLNSHQIRG